MTTSNTSNYILVTLVYEYALFLSLFISLSLSLSMYLSIYPILSCPILSFPILSYPSLSPSPSLSLSLSIYAGDPTSPNTTKAIFLTSADLSLSSEVYSAARHGRWGREQRRFIVLNSRKTHLWVELLFVFTPELASSPQNWVQNKVSQI